jgi:hypothetical protein
LSRRLTVSFTIDHDYFLNDSTQRPEIEGGGDLAPSVHPVERLSADNATAADDVSTGRKWSEESSLLSENGAASTPTSAMNIQSDEMPKTYLTTMTEQARAIDSRQTESQQLLNQGAWNYFRELIIVIVSHRGGLLRDVNLHLIISCSISGFVSIVLQFDIIPVQSGADFRNGFCGGQLMGIFILQIVSHSIFLFGAISYQTVFAMMRPHYFFSRVYVLLSGVLVLALCTKYAFLGFFLSTCQFQYWFQFQFLTLVMVLVSVSVSVF